MRTVEGRRQIQMATNIDDMGDLRSSGALRTIDATGAIVVPDAGYEQGALVDLPDWKKRGEITIAVGQGVRIALLRPDTDGKYRVEMILK